MRRPGRRVPSAGGPVARPVARAERTPAQSPGGWRFREVPLLMRRRAARRGDSAAPPPSSLYGRVLRLQGTSLPWWLRAVYVEGAVLLGFVLYLADAASAWVMLALPLAIAGVVKVYDAALTAEGRTPDVSADPATSNPARPPSRS